MDITEVYKYVICSQEKEKLSDAELKLEATAQEMAYFEREVKN